MKIERISDNQIRCTLTKSDLIERHIKISELTYGSDKAKDLFRDMMEQANIDFGFDVDDIPLMIEAIPSSRESIILVITKIDNPDEFDERFSKFGIHPDETADEDLLDSDEENPGTPMIGSTDIVDCFEQLHELLEEAGNNIPGGHAKEDTQHPENTSTDVKKVKKKKPATPSDNIRVYSFTSLDPIIRAAHQITVPYSGKNTLWKNPSSKHYHLLLHRGNSKNSFRSVCTTMAEYGNEEHLTYATPAYYNEHFQLILKDDALTSLSQI